MNSVSVHPSGKLALTVGADRSLHTWNLVTGRSAYITNIKQGERIYQKMLNESRQANLCLRAFRYDKF